MINQETKEAISQAFAELIKEAARDAVVQYKADRTGVQDEEGWVPPSKVIEAMGSAVTQKILRDKIAAGKFKYGFHYIDTSDGEKPNYAYSISAVRRYFQIHPSKRGASGKVAKLRKLA